MIRTARILAVLVCLGAASLLAPAQERGRPGSEASGGGSGASIANRGVAVGNTTTSMAPTATTSRGFGEPTSSISRSNSPSSTIYTPDLTGTSFSAVSTYYQWQDFLYHLRAQHLVDSFYFRRFYRNSEPLVTPHLLKLTLREPLALSTQMLSKVEELEKMLVVAQEGGDVDRAAISAKTKEIRDLARRIRRDQSLSFVDQRSDRDITRGLDLDQAGVAQLREIVVDLHNQLENMYGQTATSTVSIRSLNQPSFESLARGIERLAKAVENSSRKL